MWCTDFGMSMLPPNSILLVVADSRYCATCALQEVADQHHTHHMPQGLGLEYARQLASAGARCLVLTSRDPHVPAETLAGFASLGVAVFVVRADAGDAAAAARVFAWARERLPAVEHYAHAAGVSGHAPLADMTSAQLDAVLAPKARLSQHVAADSALSSAAWKLPSSAIMTSR